MPENHRSLDGLQAHWEPNAGRAIRLLLVQRVFPTYRRGFFEALSASKRLEVTLAHGEVHKSTALRDAVGSVAVQRRRLKNYAFAVGTRELLVYQAGLMQALRDVQPDVIIAEFNPRIVSNLLLWLITWFGRRHLIWWGHGFGKKGGALARKARLLLARRADGLILYGYGQRDAFVEAGFDPERLFVANNTIDTQGIAEWAKPWDATTRYRILIIGRLLREKKVDLVLRAFALGLGDLPAECILTIIGDGPERHRLEQLAGAWGIARRVEFAGPIYEEVYLAEFFNQALLSVSAGYVGLGIIHSFAYGVPMLVARDEEHSPELEALVDGGNGRLFPSDNAQALSAVMKELVENRECLKRMSDGARETVAATYSIKNMVHAFEKAVAKAIAESGAA